MGEIYMEDKGMKKVLNTDLEDLVVGSQRVNTQFFQNYFIYISDSWNYYGDVTLVSVNLNLLISSHIQ